MRSLGPQFRRACRRRASGDWAWVQHMISSMAPSTGRMAVVLPHGALFRRVRKDRSVEELLEMDLIEAVIGLARTCSTAPAWPPASWCSDGASRERAKGKVLIVDASELFRRGRNQNTSSRSTADANLTAGIGASPTLRDSAQWSRSTRSRRKEDNLNIAGYIAAGG